MNSKTKKQNISLTLHNKASKYQCMHECHQIFKSKKQKILHHNKLDKECREEKYRLLELIEVFKNIIDYFYPNKNILIKTHNYSDLLFQFKKTKKCIIDLDQYNGIVHLD